MVKSADRQISLPILQILGYCDGQNSLEEIPRIGWMSLHGSRVDELKREIKEIKRNLEESLERGSDEEIDAAFSRLELVILLSHTPFEKHPELPYEPSPDLLKDWQQMRDLIQTFLSFMEQVGIPVEWIEQHGINPSWLNDYDHIMTRHE